MKPDPTSLFQNPVFALNTEPGKWFIQLNYPGDFHAVRRVMWADDLDAVVEGRCWIATYAPPKDTTDRIIIDIDCKSEDDIDDRNIRYQTVRHLFGLERVPLVVRTPSGLGFHVMYRIPPTPLEHLATGMKKGLVPDALRAHGLTPGFGSIETYPQRTQALRIPIGRDLFILDPTTLIPIAGAPAAPYPTRGVWDWYLDELEKWYANPYADLVPALERYVSGSKLPPSSASASPARTRHPFTPIGEATAVASPELIRKGLTRPDSRYESEFLVGAAIWRQPDLFADLGVPPEPSREDVACGLARWLAERNNGLSKEWELSRRGRSIDRAIRHWTKRYLERSTRTSEAPVDRMRKAAAGGVVGCGPLSSGDMEAILSLAARLYPRGPERYQFETWTCALLRAVKRVVRHYQKVGRPVRSSPGFVEVEMSAAFMEAWPWGQGRRNGVRNYVAYRDALIAEDWIKPVAEPIWHSDAPDLPGQATIYEVWVPERVSPDELPVPIKVVEERIAHVTTTAGRTLSLDEAYHALYVHRVVRRPERRYGAKTAARIHEYAEAILEPDREVRFSA